MYQNDVFLNHPSSCRCWRILLLNEITVLKEKRDLRWFEIRFVCFTGYSELAVLSVKMVGTNWNSSVTLNWLAYLLSCKVVMDVDLSVAKKYTPIYITLHPVMTSHKYQLAFSLHESVCSQLSANGHSRKRTLSQITEGFRLRENMYSPMPLLRPQSEYPDLYERGPIPQHRLHGNWFAFIKQFLPATRVRNGYK